MTERNRRLDSDAEAVQIMTVFVAKGLQFPIVYLPFAFNHHVRSDDILLYHDGTDAAACTSAAREIASNKRRTIRAEPPSKPRATTSARLCCAGPGTYWRSWHRRRPTEIKVNGGLSRAPLRCRSIGQFRHTDALRAAHHNNDAWTAFPTSKAKQQAIGRGMDDRLASSH